MTPKNIIILYGLPGAGKSSLAQYIGENCPGYYFADVASHPRFGHELMYQCVIDLYNDHGRGRHLVTEGVLRTPEIRNRFAHRIYKALSPTRPMTFRMPRLVFVDERSATLSSRRPSRKVAAYEEMMTDFVVGSGKYPHGVLPGDAVKTLQERADWVIQGFGRMRPDDLEAAPTANALNLRNDAELASQG